MAVQLFNFEDIHVRSMTVDGLVYFAAKEIGQALGYADIPWAIKAHVDAEYTTTFGELQRNAPTACISGPGVAQGLTESRLRGLVDAVRPVFKKALRQEVQEICVRRGLASLAKKGCVRHQKQPDATFERNRFARECRQVHQSQLSRCHHDSWPWGNSVFRRPANCLLEEGLLQRPARSDDPLQKRAFRGLGDRAQDTGLLSRARAIATGVFGQSPQRRLGCDGQLVLR